MAVKIIIDSASDISEKEAKELGVIMVPMTITFGKEEYLDGVNLLPKDFYEKLIETNIFPKTSQINEYTWAQVFKEHTANGDDLVVITLSSKLSGTYNSAVKASENYKDKVYVVDSLNAAVGERLLCNYALRLVNLGKSAKQVAEMLNEKKTKINFIAMLGTLDYLKKGGRISATVAFAGKLLSIKPVVSIVDGKVKLIGKAIGSKNGSNLLNKFIKERGGIDFSMPYGVIWSGLDNSLLKKYVADSSYLWEKNTSKIPEYMLGGTIGTHIGPGGIGVAYFEK
ncbi:MAG: DegV family protein [Christensenellales bacterium]